MKVNTQSVNFVADQKLLDFIQKKMDKLDMFYDKVICSDVFLKVENTSEKEEIFENKSETALQSSQFTAGYHKKSQTLNGGASGLSTNKKRGKFFIRFNVQDEPIRFCYNNLLG